MAVKSSKKHRWTLCGASLAALSMAVGMGAGSMAFAQDEVADDEEIVVTGFRASLAEALDVKRDATGIVDAIVAEDIASFPDLNLAESIQRVPGVSIDRVAGEGRRITVRGLGADFTRIRINGMEALNTTGASDSSGGSNRGRGFDFNTFASDLFNSITVRKTASASVEEGSLGATVDLRTARPFDYDSGLTAAASGQVGYNDLSEETSPRYAGLLSWVNDQNTFGILGSLAFSDRTILEEGFSTVRWDDGNFGSCAVGLDCSAINGSSQVYHPRIPRYGRLTHEQERFGATLSVQARPTSATEVSFDVLYSSFEGTRDEEYLEVFARSQQSAIDVNDYSIDADTNSLDYMDWTISPLANGTHPIRTEHRFDVLETEFMQFTLDVQHDFTDRLRGNVLAGFVSSEHDNPIQTTILADAIGVVSNYVYDFRGNGQTPFVSFGSLDVADPTQWAFTEFRDRPQTVDNTFETLAGDLSYEVSAGLTVEGGLSFKRFTFDTEEYRRESTFGSLVCSYGGYTCSPGATGAPIAGDLIGYVTGFGSGLGAPSGIDTVWISPNVQAAAELIGLYTIPGAAQAGNMRSVEEQDLGGWVQLNFETMIGSMPLRGDVGVRYVETTTESTGQVAGLDVTVSRTYEDTLPALNLTLEATDDFLVRFGAAGVMARPSLGNLTPGGSLDSFNGPPFRYTAGNPGLDPYRATTYDLSFEWYFAEEALLSLGLFYKDVSSFFVQTEDLIVPFSSTGLPTTLAPASSPLRNLLDSGADPDVTLRAVQNGGDAAVQGFEIVYQQPFSFLPAPFDNFGFQGNYTYVDSDEIIGFSPNAFNATLYYEGDRLAARVSSAYRDAYQTQSPGANGRNEQGYAETFNVDFSSSFSLTDSLDITFEAINLTDEFEHQVFDAADLVTTYHHTGTEYMIGFRWRN